MRYTIVNNGSNPFVVETKGNRIKVWDTILGDPDMPSKLLMDFEFEELFDGDKSHFAKEFGTTLLVRDKYSYILITSYIIRFWAFDIIREFHAPIVGFRVPYPYAIGYENVYFNEEDKIVCVPKFEFDLTKNVIDQYYGRNGFTVQKVGTPLTFQFSCFSGSLNRQHKFVDFDKIPTITRKESIRRQKLKNKREKTNQEKYELDILEAKNELKWLRKNISSHEKEYHVDLIHLYIELADERQKYFNLKPIQYTTIAA